MRIRKRKVPLPLSLLSPVPLSDPHLFSRSPVIMVHSQPPDPANPPAAEAQPSDHLTLTSSDNSASDLRRLIVEGGTSITSTGGGDAVKEQLYFLGFGEGERNQDNNGGSNASTGIPTTLGAVAATPTPNDNNGPVALLSNQENDEKYNWSDRDRAVPLKKRRASFEQQESVNASLMKSKTNKLMCFQDDQVRKVTPDCSHDRNHNDETNVVVVAVGDETSNNNNNNNNNNGGVKRGSSGKRGNTIMEGSRCSRVNGRGWRCCQPTLVGYSLCEHHLGKGRLRSMASSGSTGRGRPGLTSKKPVPVPALLSSPGQAVAKERARTTTNDDHDDEDEVEMKQVSTVNSIGKRVKLGVVKARSLSSLLGQTSQTTITSSSSTTNNNNNNNNNGDIAKASTRIQETSVVGANHSLV